MPQDMAHLCGRELGGMSTSFALRKEFLSCRSSFVCLSVQRGHIA